MTELDWDRILLVVDGLRRAGFVTGPRLADCPDLSDQDLRMLTKRTDDRLRRAAYNALRLRKARRRPAAAHAAAAPAPTPADAPTEPGASGGEAASGALPVLQAGGAVVQVLDEDHVLVLGNTELGRQFGPRLRDLSPELTRRASDAVGELLAASSAGLQAAAAAQSISQSGAVFVVTKASRHLLADPLAQSSGGALGWVRPGGKGIAHLRFSQAGTGLRALSSITGLVFTLSVIAGQARMDRTLSQICLVLDDVKEMSRDQQISEVTVAAEMIRKVWQAAELTGELTAGLVEMLPSRQQLMENVDRSAREVARLQRRLDDLPGKASEKLKVLESTVPDMLLSLGLYAEAERALSAAEALYRYDLTRRGDVAAPAVTHLEAEQRRARLSAGARFARDLDRSLSSVEEHPGGGWFSGSTRTKVRNLAQQVRDDLPALGLRSLTTASAQGTN